MELEEKQYPYFIPCTQAEWSEWNTAATKFIVEKHGEGGGDNYSNPFIDAEGGYHFLCNQEVEELIPEGRREGKQYEEVNW